MKQIKIVITGGPSGGKTTFIESLKKTLGKKIAVVPEAASILFKGGFPRYKNAKSSIMTQKAIYHVQQEIEDLVIFNNPSAKIIICDRGSLDGEAYWPANPDLFYKSLKTNRKKELQRYNWVIHLDTAAIDSYDCTNPVRIESHQEAVRLNTKLIKAWAGHSNRVIISEKKDFFYKMSEANLVVNLILEGNTISEIQNILEGK